MVKHVVGERWRARYGQDCVPESCLRWEMIPMSTVLGQNEGFADEKVFRIDHFVSHADCDDFEVL
jgi:hypothetical protein